MPKKKPKPRKLTAEERQRLDKKYPLAAKAMKGQEYPEPDPTIKAVGTTWDPGSTQEEFFDHLFDMLKGSRKAGEVLEAAAVTSLKPLVKQLGEDLSDQDLRLLALLIARKPNGKYYASRDIAPALGISHPKVLEARMGIEARSAAAAQLLKMFRQDTSMAKGRDADPRVDQTALADREAASDWQNSGEESFDPLDIKDLVSMLKEMNEANWRDVRDVALEMWREAEFTE